MSNLYASDWISPKKFAAITNRSVPTLYRWANRPDGHPCCRWVDSLGLQWSPSLWYQFVSDSPCAKPHVHAIIARKSSGRRPRFNGGIA